MKNTISKASIIKAITESQSAEISGNTATYYLHLTEDGEILDSMYDADYTFTADRDISAYEDDESPDRVYDTETMEDETFSDMIYDLCKAVSEVFEVVE